jgi:DNA repair protein RecN (Recombination protein N)
MLSEILIQNYAVIENLALEFQPGLNLLSGETGSGKSILVDALGLALGGRASPEVIRTGAGRATVTAVFRSPDGAAPWKAWLEENALAGGAVGEIILRREISSNGKSRLLVNDQPVTVAAVKSLARVLLEVHGQSEHVALLAPDAQLDLLDQFADSDDQLARVGECHVRRHELERERNTLVQSETGRLRAIDLAQFQVRELDQADIMSGEDARLEEEKRVLSNLEKIRSAAAGAYQQVYEDEGSASARLAAATRAIEELGRYDSAFEAYREPLASARASLDDLAIFLRDYLGRLDSSPHRLAEVEDRLALLDRLKRKYGGSIEAMLDYRQQARRELENLQNADERREEVEREAAQAAAAYRRAAQELSRRRREAATRLTKQVLAELAQMGMEKTRFEVRFEDLPEERATARGADSVEFRISPNPGEELRPLEKIASGGELSRLMLALKTVVGKSRGGARRGAHTFIFDEVDAGIGGKVAEFVGRRLQRLARDAQVLCVTHLAQIAAFADHHYFVEKSERHGRTVATVTCLPGPKERAQELARMLSGTHITPAALKHAASMLEHARASDE